MIPVHITLFFNLLARTVGFIECQYMKAPLYYTILAMKVTSKRTYMLLLEITIDCEKREIHNYFLHCGLEFWREKFICGRVNEICQVFKSKLYLYTDCKRKSRDFARVFLHRLEKTSFSKYCIDYIYFTLQK